MDKYIKRWWDENIKNGERLFFFFLGSDRILPLVCPELNLSKNFTQIISNLWIAVALVWFFFLTVGMILHEINPVVLMSAGYLVLLNSQCTSMVFILN